MPLRLAEDDIQVFIQSAANAFGTTNTNAHQYQHTGMLFDLDGLDGAIEPPTDDHPADPDEALHYRVFAVNSAGMGASSHDDTQKNRRQNTVDASMVTGQGAVPSMPTDVIWDDDGLDNNGADAKTAEHHYGEVNLAWTAPSDDPNGYRIDVAKGANQRWGELEDDTGDADPTYDHERWRPDAPAPQTYYYRIFSVDGGLIGLAHGIANYAVDGQTAPTAVLELEVDEATTTAGQISISWEAPENDGGTPITAYCILEKVGSAPFPANAAAVDTACTEDDGDLPSGTTRNEASKVGALTVAPPATELTRKNLIADETYKYKVYAVNDAEDSVGPPTVDAGEEFSTSAEERTEDTKEAVKAGAPLNLTAESAKDANFDVRSQLGVLLLWTGPEHPAGAKITGYSIERSMDGGTTWESLESHRSGDNTHFEDRRNPRDDDVLHYRVAAINSEGTGPWSAMVRFPQHDEPHGPHTPVSTALTAPTMVSAMGGTGELTVTWVDGKNAVGHLVLLLDGAEIEAMETAPAGNSHRFTDLSPGVYTAVVVSYKSTSDYDYDYDADSVQ